MTLYTSLQVSAGYVAVLHLIWICYRAVSCVGMAHSEILVLVMVGRLLEGSSLCISTGRSGGVL